MDMKNLAEKYGLKIKKLEDGVYEVLNRKMSDVSVLSRDYKDIALIVSGNNKSKKGSDCSWHTFSEVLYIVLCRDDNDMEKIWSIEDKLENNFPKVYTVYHTKDDIDSIDTIYSRMG